MPTRTTALAVALALLAACAAAPPPPPKQPWDVPANPARAAASPAAPGGQPAAAPAPAPAAPDDLKDLTPVAYAARFPAPDACEAAARRLLRSSPDRAWAVLRACVERGKFTALRRLLDGAWDKELQARNDAALLLGRVVAARGGDVLGDLASFRKARVPIFGLEPAMTTPDVYRGRVLLFRARIEEISPQPGNKSTIRFSQVELAGQTRFVEGDTQYRSTSSSSSSGSASASGSYSGSTRGPRGGTRSSASGSGNASYTGSGRSEYTSGYAKKRTDNELQDTGRTALARAGPIDPFLEPGRDFVVVGRFDGVRQTPGESEDSVETVAVFTLYGYYEASPILVE
ncbi:MAG TPA: hypothetical protein VIV59_02920 [Anaeromyxobacteraceae bacterium]